MFPESVILVVGSESDESESVASMLSVRYRVIGVEKPDDALTYANDGVDMVVSQLDSPDFSGLQLLRSWKLNNSRTPFLFITDGGDVTSAVEAMKLGAADCLVRPINVNHLRTAVSRALERTRSSTNVDSPSEGRLNIEIPPGTSLEDLERVAVEQALAQHNGNRTHAAKTLGISVRTLQRKLKAWGMPVMTNFPSNRQPGNGNSGRSNSRIMYTEQPGVHSASSFGAHAH
jgi:DNA-binding NtrC family response regulator